MKSNKDLATTILGGILAAGTAAQPVMNSVEGSMHQADYLQLAMAVVMAIFGYFTNKGSHSGE